MRETPLNEHYKSDFYFNNKGAVSSAQVILGMLYKFYKPLSVIDIGCGQGAWLSVAESLGSQKINGLDGNWVKKEKLLSKNINFTAVNMEEEFEVEGKYDLCISLEVAEHLPESRAKNFVKVLCKASDVVLFSAAIKHQGGTNHINKQWQSYWVDLFRSNGYECFDIFRAAIWENESVELWYRQNIFLFVNKTADLINLDKLRSQINPIVNVVHPVICERRLNEYKRKLTKPTLRFCLENIKRYILGKIKT